ncbi:hypothetical protein ASG75_09660 [Rhodanobacter sp. Soil772]|uniref:abortive infection family protein n=1 Tax=Rhodanobacter sp. Soil772 TaxID=1736406 RepID=UPI0006F928BD|nr:abortive infection family protein [Rhodanobacter sp. Soil772]KRE85814.1 hypothetical protein ASG75_09660 [Rhodanobacter sp. Soil772]
MIRLYQGTGSTEIDLDDQRLDGEKWIRAKTAAVRLLRAKGLEDAADFLDRTPFELRTGTNYFNDDFSVLYYAAPMDRYIELSEQAADRDLKRNASAIAHALSELGNSVRFIAVECNVDDTPSPVPSPNLAITSDLVERALAETERAVANKGGVAGVDRAHTAFHGYLRAICAQAQIEYAADADITQLFKLIQKHHPAMRAEGPRNEDVVKIGRAMASILDALNPIRNRATLAHANDTLLQDGDAMLVINTIRTFLHYLNGKLSG